jgi:hypothetical protein
MYLLEDEPRELGSKGMNILKLEPTFKLFPFVMPNWFWTNKMELMACYCLFEFLQ